jgi:hypothetical protein
MAIQQVVQIVVTLLGDGTNSVFTFALANMYQSGLSGSIPFGTAGVVPSAVSIKNPPVPITSSTVDTNGNVTITLTSPLGNNIALAFEIDLLYNSGAATSTSPIMTQSVTLTAGASVIGAVNVQANNIPLTATLFGSPPVESLNVYVVNPINATFSATSIGVTQITSPWVVSGTVTANQGGAWTVAATQSGTWTVQQGTPPWSVSQSGAWTVTANQGTSPWTVAGNKTNNNAASGATNIGTLPAVATTAAPVYATGNQVALSTDLAGNLRTAIITALPTGANTIGAVTQSGAWTVAATQSGAWSVNQTIGVAGFEKITDGTNTAAVKPASTTPAATDPALVVTLSPNSSTITVSTTQGHQATYRVASGTVAANLVTPSFIPHAGVLFQIQGSATKVVNVLHFSLSASGASATYVDISMQRTSSAATGGTAVTPIVAKADTTDANATAVATYYTAAPTPGTFVANLLSERFFFPQAPYTSTYLDFIFGDLPGTKAVTLRGTSDFFTVQLAGTVPTTPAMDFYCVWTEE